MLQAALFELEGVLVDTLATRREALCRALADDGVHLTPERFDAWCAGLPVAHAVAEAVRRLAAEQPSAAVLDDTARDLVALRAGRAAAGRFATGASLAPGVRATLDVLAGSLRLALVTRAGRGEVDTVLALSGLEAHFSCVVTADDVRTPKPAPDAYRRALGRLARHGVTPSGTVAFEDASPGVVAARAAGVRVVRVAPASDARSPDGADARLPSIAGLTPRSLAALLDLAPVPT